jgi:hypothetical protein
MNYLHELSRETMSMHYRVRLTPKLDCSRNILNDMLLVITLADCKVDVLETQHGTCEEGAREIR